MHNTQLPLGVIRVGWPMPEKGPFYAHLRKDDQWTAAAALGQKRPFKNAAFDGRLAPISVTVAAWSTP